VQQIHMACEQLFEVYEVCSILAESLQSFHLSYSCSSPASHVPGRALHHQHSQVI
jgi:hypothetical protein